MLCAYIKIPESQLDELCPVIITTLFFTSTSINVPHFLKSFKINFEILTFFLLEITLSITIKMFGGTDYSLKF